MDTQKPWVIFDADNTLWQIEHFYDDARKEMCRFMADRGFNPSEVEQYQRNRDSALHETYGYSACRFARSFEDTAVHFEAGVSADVVRHVRRLALNVFEQLSEPVEGLDDLLHTLVAAGYRLGIITAGERWVQERRLNNFQFRERFHAIEIVDIKTTAALEAFCAKYLIDKQCSWMVGDSLRSDIEPALEIGLHGVLVKAVNWNTVESRHSKALGDYMVIPDLRELPKVPGILAT